MSAVSRIAAGVRVLLAARLVYAAANVLLVVLLTRYLLEPDVFGRLQFALSILVVVALFGTLGLPKSTARYLTEYVERDPTQIRYILRRSVWFVCACSGVVGLLVSVTSGRLADAFGDPELLLLLVVGGVYVPLYGLHSHLAYVFQGFNRVAWNGLMRSINGIGQLVVGAGLAFLGFGAVGVLFGYVVALGLGVAVGTAVLYRRFYRQYPPTKTPETHLTRSILRYSIPLTATKAANVVDKRLDTILVGVLLNPTAVGYYVVARNISDIVTMPASSFGFTLSPVLGEQKAQEDVGGARRLYEEALVYTLLFYVPAAAGLALVAEPVVITIFGTDYLSAALVVQILAAYTVIHSVNQITSDGLDYLGRANTRAVAKVIMAVANVGLNFALIPLLGVAGAAVATVVTYGCYTLYNVYVIYSELAIEGRRILRHGVHICAITAAVVLVVLVALPHVSGPVSLVGTVLAGGGVWAALAVASGMLDLGRLRTILT